MPEQLLIPFPDADADADSESRSALDMTALRALKESRTDVEALDLTAERLRHLQDAFTAAADRARATMDSYADREPTDGPHRRARTTSRSTARSSPGRTAGERPATECTRFRAPDAAVRTDDAPHSTAESTWNLKKRKLPHGTWRCAESNVKGGNRARGSTSELLSCLGRSGGRPGRRCVPGRPSHCYRR
jgi:hypothetical protein